MHNVLTASAVLPYHQPNANVVDLRLRLTACALDERQAWETLHHHLLQALRLHSVEIHIDCDSECLRVKANTPEGCIETRLAHNDVLTTALQILENQQSSDNDRLSSARTWFLISLDERDHLFQLDYVQHSSGRSYTLRRLYDLQNPLPQLDELITLRGQSTQLRERLTLPDGLILLADTDRISRGRTARALAQSKTSPGRRILLSEITCHPLAPGINQIILPLEDGREQLHAWQQACDMSYDIIFALEITHAPVKLVRLATENCLVVQGVCASSASKALAQLIATGTRPEAIARALKCIIVQHQVALACDRCKSPALISDELNEWIGQQSPVRPGAIQDWLSERLSDSFMQAYGCAACNDTGIGKVVLLIQCVDVSNDIQDALNDGDIRYAMDMLDGSDTFPAQLISLARRGAIAVDYAIDRIDSVRRHAIADIRNVD